MKNVVWVFISYLLTSPLANAQSILNRGFENWDSTVLDKPSQWISSNDEFYENGPICVSKTTESRDGFALNLTTASLPNGGVKIGYLTNSTGDAFNGEGGVPYTKIPDAISGYYKGDFNSGDSAVLLLVFKKNGVIITRNTFKIGTSTNSFTLFSFPINLNDNPDTIVFLVSSSDMMSDQELSSGNTITLDDITLEGIGITEQLPNTSFEEWTSYTSYRFKGWTRTSAAVTRSTDYFKGKAAAYIPVVDFGNSLILGSSLALGEPNEDGKRQGIPYQLTNDTLAFYYKFNAIGEDTAFVLVSIIKSGIIIAGIYEVLEPTDTYQLKKIPLYSDLTPDTLSLIFSVAQGQINPPTIGSALYIDEVILNSEFISSGMFNSYTSNKLVNIYPNPVQTELFVWQAEHRAVNYQISDLTGKVMLSGLLTNNPINVSILHQGIYFITLSNPNQQRITQKIVKQ